MAVYTITQGEKITASILNTYAMNSGLVYVTQATATSGTILDLTSCFSSTYDSYRVVVSDIRATAGVGISVTLLAGTTPAASNWTWMSARLDYSTSGWNIQKATGDSRTQNVAIPGTSAVSLIIDVTNPFSSQYSVIYCNSTDFRGSTGYTIVNTNGLLMNTTSYSGIRIYSEGPATLTNMKAIVYGYRQA